VSNFWFRSDLTVVQFSDGACSPLRRVFRFGPLRALFASRQRRLDISCRASSRGFVRHAPPCRWYDSSGAHPKGMASKFIVANANTARINNTGPPLIGSSIVTETSPKTKVDRRDSAQHAAGAEGTRENGAAQYSRNEAKKFGCPSARTRHAQSWHMTRDTAPADQERPVLLSKRPIRVAQRTCHLRGHARTQVSRTVRRPSGESSRIRACEPSLP